MRSPKMEHLVKITNSIHILYVSITPHGIHAVIDRHRRILRLVMSQSNRTRILAHHIDNDQAVLLKYEK
jgi:exopolyphosphatase/pppGpp-phosphohydrolase